LLPSGSITVRHEKFGAYRRLPMFANSGARIRTALVLTTALLAWNTPMNAVWHSDVQNLPGMESGKKIARDTALIAGAAIGGTLLYMKFVRHRPPAELGLSTSDVRFGAIARATPKIHEISVTNKSQRSSTINAIEVSGESFALSGEAPMPASLKPGETYRFSVMFTPEADRKYKGQVRIRALVSGKNGPSTLAVDLEGRGMPEAITATPTRPAVLAANQ
jgi:hypothetical protein